MPEFLILLLPIAAASGWWAAKRSVRKEREKLRNAEIDPAYFRGLNYLVNEQPDKAIDVFVRMLEVNSETVEMHLALGSLFRRRGETDRAIRIHQNLIARPTLSSEQRSQALMELGLDYMNAGLLDRAEALFSELIDNHALVKTSLGNLKVIYQHEKDWLKALDVTRRLEELGGEDQSRDRSHFLCELADIALQKGRDDDARDYLEQAGEAAPKAMRPLLTQATLYLQKQDYTSALQLYQRIAETHPAFIGEFVNQMAKCHRETGQEQAWLTWLMALYQRRRSLYVMLAIADEIEHSEGSDAAIRFLNDELVANPTLLGVQRLIRMRLTQQGDGKTTFLDTLDTLVKSMTDKQSAYQCHRCGFTTRTLHWQCPGCRTWGTMLPTSENNGRYSE